LNPIPLQQL